MAELGKPESQAIGREPSRAAKKFRARTNGFMHQRHKQLGRSPHRGQVDDGGVGR